MSRKTQPAPDGWEKPERGVLIGWRQIGMYLGVSEHTAARYAQEEGLPVAYLPDGRRAISKSLIDAWFLERHSGNPD